MSHPTEIEKENLEAHVELCAVRYATLETKLNSLEDRMDKLEVHLVDIKKAITSSADSSHSRTISILVSVLGIILSALLGYIGSGLFK